MTNVSKWESDAWRRLIKRIAGASSPQRAEKILATLTTAYERKQISRRAAALELLKEGKSYNQISRELWLSPTIINALRKSVQGGEGYVSSHERIKKLGKRKVWSSFAPRPRRGLDPKKYIPPHGKLAHPVRRRY